MKNISLLLLSCIFLYTCIYSECEDFTPECFTRFGEFRMNIYFDSEEDSSYRLTENWVITSRFTFNPPPKVSYEETCSCYRITISDSLYLAPSQDFTLNFGNGDVDTVDYKSYGFSTECCEASWVAAITVNGDSLVRDSDYAFMFVK